MSTTRRGFLKILGTAPLSALPMAGTKAEATGTAFRFTCSCGGEVIASVPKHIGQHVEADCDGCGLKYDLEWRGDHFRTRMRK
jgi:hypothetical protein